MDTIQKYTALAFRFLSYRSRSEQELRIYLAKKQAEESMIEQIVQTLTSQKFLNDESFASWWVEQRTRIRPKGSFIIRRELQEKGISDRIIDLVLTNRGGQAEESLVREIVVKRIPRYKGISKQEILQKLGNYLLRRGFAFDTVRRVIDSEAPKGV